MGLILKTMSSVVTDLLIELDLTNDALRSGASHFSCHAELK